MARPAAWGIPAAGKETLKQWCMDCAKGHDGARCVRPRKACVGCRVRTTDWERINKRQWCSACVAGTALVKCEGCGVKQELPERSRRLSGGAAAAPAASCRRLTWAN